MLASSPHQSTTPEELMKDFKAPSQPAPLPVATPTCPTCGSSVSVTTAATPSPDSYWRCTECGDVWNVSRTQNNRYGAQRRR